MNKVEFNKVMDVFDAHYDIAVSVLAYVLANKGRSVTTPMLIEAGVMTGQQVNHVRAVVTTLNWALLYPHGRTRRWWVTPEGELRVERSQRSL